MVRVAAASQQVGPQAHVEAGDAPAPAAGEGRFGTHGIALEKPLRHAYGGHAQRAIAQQRPQHPAHALPRLLELPYVPKLMHHQPIEPVHGAQPKPLLRRSKKLDVPGQKRHEAVGHRGLVLHHHRNGSRIYAQRRHIGPVHLLQPRRRALRRRVEAARIQHPEMRRSHFLPAQRRRILRKNGQTLSRNRAGKKQAQQPRQQ